MSNKSHLSPEEASTKISVGDIFDRVTEMYGENESAVAKQISHKAVRKELKRLLKSIPVYCKCNNCNEFFVVTSGRIRKYCTEKCRKAAYYLRRKNKDAD